MGFTRFLLFFILGLLFMIWNFSIFDAILFSLCVQPVPVVSSEIHDCTSTTNKHFFLALFKIISTWLLIDANEIMHVILQFYLHFSALFPRIMELLSTKMNTCGCIPQRNFRFIHFSHRSIGIFTYLPIGDFPDMRVARKYLKIMRFQVPSYYQKMLIFFSHFK